MQSIYNSLSTASSHAVTIWNTVSAKNNTQHIAQFWNQHGAAISDIALLAGDFYCLWEAPVTLLSSFVMTTCASDNMVSAASMKVIKIWEQHTSAKPLITGGIVIFSAWQPQRALASICGFYTSARLKSMIL